MLRKASRIKPDKPYEGFPLTAHKNGQWCKKIRGKVHYFGPWDDWQGSLALYREQRDDLHAGRKPRPRTGGITLADVMNRFLYSKKLLVETGELTQRTYNEYEQTCVRLKESIGASRLVSDLGTDDFEQLRSDLGKGQRGIFAPGTLKGALTRARMVFNYANESGLAEKPISYRKPLKAPSQRSLRKADNERGPQMFERAEINKMLKKAGPQLKAMIYLGINCGFGNTDCGMLPLNAIDLDKGWHRFWRPKTHNPRRCPLWPETIDALRVAIDERPEPKSPMDEGLVFLTKYGHGWCHSDTDRSNPISYELRKLLQDLKIYRKHVTTFYSLRRTFETIGATAGEQVAVDYIMGHVPGSDDMAAVYRQKQFNKPLLKVTNHVRKWLLGKVRIS